VVEVRSLQRPVTHVKGNLGFSGGEGEKKGISKPLN
jgi:hypothetical protein